MDKTGKKRTNNSIVSATRKTWYNMHQRCYNEEHASYEKYGGRGITVCEDWWDFDNFLRDMGYKPTIEFQIHRIDNARGYCRENCRWATPTEQNLAQARSVNFRKTVQHYITLIRSMRRALYSYRDCAEMLNANRLWHLSHGEWKWYHVRDAVDFAETQYPREEFGHGELFDAAA